MSDYYYYYLQKGNSSEAIEMGERPGSAASNDGERASSPTALLSNTNTYMTMNDNSQRTYAATKSLRHQLTREALPRLDNYRNILSIQAGHRPTLDELHNATIHEKVKNTKMFPMTSQWRNNLNRKFGNPVVCGHWLVP
jgi:solute carrier family 12 sodium/potassium/chloride transporter 2